MIYHSFLVSWVSACVWLVSSLFFSAKPDAVFYSVFFAATIWTVTEFYTLADELLLLLFLNEGMLKRRHGAVVTLLPLRRLREDVNVRDGCSTFSIPSPSSPLHSSRPPSITDTTPQHPSLHTEPDNRSPIRHCSSQTWGWLCSFRGGSLISSTSALTAQSSGTEEAHIQLPL